MLDWRSQRWHCTMFTSLASVIFGRDVEGSILFYFVSLIIIKIISGEFYLVHVSIISVSFALNASRTVY